MKSEVLPLTITVVYMSNFRCEVLSEKRPVLLCCLHKGMEYEQQYQSIEQIARRYGPALKVCLAAQEDVKAIGEACRTTGTPAFLFFRRGREEGRLLGEADEAGLSSFLDL